MGKNASFKGDVSGTIENQVNDWDTQTIGGTKTFTNQVHISGGIDFDSSTISGSGNISASFFYGDATHLTNAGTITSYTSHATNRLIAGGASSTAIKGVSGLSYAASKLSVTGELSASTNISASQFYGNGTNVTGLVGTNITSGLISAARINLASDGALESDPSARLRVKVSASNGLMTGSNGLKIDVVDALGAEGSYSDANVIIVQGTSGPPKKQALSVLETNMTIAGGNITGTNSINNTRLPTTISQQILSASTAISGAFIEGDGGGLVNVTAGGAGADTQVQFNDGGNLAGNAGFTFGKTTGVMTVTTGSFTKISSHLIPNANNSRALGDADNSLRWSGVNAVAGNFSGRVVMSTGSVSHRFAVGNLNPLNEFEVTGSSHFIGNISASVNVSASQFYGSGANLTNTINSIDNYTANRMLVAGGNANNIDAVTQVTFNNPNFAVVGNISASSDVLVGGHITGSGNIVLSNNNNNRIQWDLAAGSDEGPYIHGVSSSSGVGHTKKLEIHGDNDLNLMADSIIRLKVPDDTLTVTINSTVVSSSVDISASAMHFADSPAGVITSGGNTFLDNNGNVFAGNVTSQGNISASVNVSASAFYGDGSNLQNVPSPTYEYLHGNKQFNNSLTNFPWFKVRGGTGQVNAVSHDAHWIAPCSGSVHMVLYTPTSDNLNTEGFETGDTPHFFFRKNDNTDNEANLTFNATASSGQIVDFTYKNATGDVNTKRAIFDFGSSAVTNITGSNSFDPGDLLVFGGYNPQDTLNDIGWTIVLNLQQD